MGTEPTSPPASDDLSFEGALERLEEIVARLEDGELELEAALAVFEEGVGLSRRCSDQLGDAERRIEVLVREGGGLVARSFDSEGADESSGE